MDVFSTIKEIFVDVFDDENLEITRETSAADIEDWDSLAQIRLTVAIEKALNIKFAFGELAKLKNVGEMLDLIDSKLEENG